jgi:hypothetical protein
MQDKSFAHRGYFSKQSFEAMGRLLRNPKFRETIHTRTAQVSNVFRIAVSLGLAELEKRYSKAKKDGQTE